MSSSVLPFGPVRTRVPSNPAPLPVLRSVKLLDRLRERIRLMHDSRRTEEAYVYGCRTFIRFHGLRHPSDLGKEEVQGFLTHLAVDRQVAVSTHRQALSALLRLYDKLLEIQLPWMAQIGRPVPRRRLPVVLTPDEVAAVLADLRAQGSIHARA